MRLVAWLDSADLRRSVLIRADFSCGPEPCPARITDLPGAHLRSGDGRDARRWSARSSGHSGPTGHLRSHRHPGLLRHNGDVVARDHLPSDEDLASWPAFTQERPLELLASACLLGVPCGVDGTSYGAPYPHTECLVHHPNVHVVTFCPEEFAFGTPRETPDIHGGDGFDVLDGRARVLSDTGEDWTEQMLHAAHAMLTTATQNRVRLALLMDISAACGSQVIYDGARSQGQYQAGQGVCAALLVRHGVKVVSQRDHRTLEAVLGKLDPGYRLNPAARDHHETQWYVEIFGAQ
jgi:uncharacterized protein YbbK (DUF523 family)